MEWSGEGAEEGKESGKERTMEGQGKERHKRASLLQRFEACVGLLLFHG